MTRETVLRGARIVLPDEVILGAVRIHEGRIAEISAGASAAGEDLAGDHLLPGLVELHTDHLESHYSPRPGVTWEPLPAVLAHDAQLAAAGMTTVLDAIRVGTEPRRDDEVAEASRRLADAVEAAAEAGLLRADHALHLRCEVSAENCLEGFRDFDGDRHVRLVSLMDHTPGERQFTSEEDFRRYYLGKGRLSEAELDGYIARLTAQSLRYAEPQRRAIADLAAQRGIPLAAHDDATPEHVAEAIALGARLTEFPTTLSAARAAHDHGLPVVMGAPNIVRGVSQSGNVAAAELLAEGLLDVLSSDYVPASPLQAIFQLAADGAIDLPHGARLVSGNPARAVGLADRGEIAVGQRADLVRVQPHELPSTERHPHGRRIPVVRGVYREGARVL